MAFIALNASLASCKDDDDNDQVNDNDKIETNTVVDIAVSND